MRKRWLFRTQVVIRLLLIFVMGFGAIIIALRYSEYYLMIIWLSAFTLLGTFSLIRYVERSYRALGEFLISIKQNDFSNSYLNQEHLSPEMISAFETIHLAFKSLRNEKESNFQLLKTIISHSGIPLITYQDATEEVLLINESATDLLKIPYLAKLSGLEKVAKGLTKVIKGVPNERKQLQPLLIKGKTYQLSIGMKKMVLNDTNISVVILNDIAAELDQKEIESWQRLIRVMTHEIKNSVIPISTLSEVIHTLLKEEDGTERDLKILDEEEQEDLRTGIRTIEKRSKGLVEFVTSYNDLTKVPQPKPAAENLNALIEDLLGLESEELKKRKIKVIKNLPRSPIIYPIDLQMIEQVIINLLKNAMEALEGQQAPILSVSLSDDGVGKISIHIKDNGPGMDNETLSNVFVPFYTTKEKGSGIGLPLSRQILRAHGAQLKIRSTQGEGTSLEIIFIKS